MEDERRKPLPHAIRLESGKAVLGPVLADILAWVDCRVVAEHDAGDHDIVIGRVIELDAAHTGKPLLFYRGGYGRFEA